MDDCAVMGIPDSVLDAKPILSRYVHCIERDGVSALYHALTSRVVFLPSAVWERVSQLDGTIPLRAIFHSGVEASRNVLETMIGHHFLLGHKETDDLLHARFAGQCASAGVQVLYLVLTDACNFACDYCFMLSSESRAAKSPRLMSPEIALQGLRAALRNRSEAGDFCIIFYGGEPLLNADVMKVVTAEVSSLVTAGEISKKPRLVIVTNGSLIDDALAVWLRDNEVNVAFSLDGDAAINDASRAAKDGSSPFEHVERAIACCRRNDLPFGLSVTLTDAAVRNYDAVMGTILRLSPRSIGFNILLSAPGVVTPTDYAEMAGRFILKAFDELAAVGIFEDRVMRKARAFGEHQFYPFDCGAAGASQLVIAPDGRVGICHGYLKDGKYFGSSVTEPGFAVAAMPGHDEWARRSPINMSQCQDCFALGLCGGGCPMNAEQRGSSIWDADERFCIHAKMTIEWLIWRLYDKTVPV